MVQCLLMKPERTIAYKEMNQPPEIVGRQFLDRWFIPDVLTKENLHPSFLKNIGNSLITLGARYPKSDPKWDFPGWEDRLSIYNLGDLDEFTGGQRKFRGLWSKILNSINRSALYIPKGSTANLREFDYLVTTPVAKAMDHVKEAEDSIALYKRTGKIDSYYRNIYPFPKNLKIGSKFFYVDGRAIRGFAVVTSINPSNEFRTRMSVDTWRWINPIPCDYGKIKPPQGYSSAQKHIYFKGIDSIKIVGGWLDPMPK